MKNIDDKKSDYRTLWTAANTKIASIVCDSLFALHIFVVLVLVLSDVATVAHRQSTLPSPALQLPSVLLAVLVTRCSSFTRRAFAILQKSAFREQTGDFVFPEDGLKGRSNSVTWEALLKITSAGVISSPVGRLIINTIHMLPVTWVIESMSRLLGASDAFSSIGC